MGLEMVPRLIYIMNKCQKNKHSMTNAYLKSYLTSGEIDVGGCSTFLGDWFNKNSLTHHELILSSKHGLILRELHKHGTHHGRAILVGIIKESVPVR
jgi:hypothetical protein